MEQLSFCAGALLAVGTLFALYPSADAMMRELPLPNELRECYKRAQNYTVQNYVGGLYTWFCESPLRAQLKGSPTPMKPGQNDYYRSLYSKVEKNILLKTRGKRQATPGARPRCLRKEYRMLSDVERNRFHAAVNGLKTNTTVEPNKYDALALIHTGIATFVAHGGQGFPGWHRVYLLMIEDALQEFDNTVCLPYWDSTLDSHLANPADSYIWSADFLGNGDGEVVTGPFANWITPDGIALRRSVGADGMLFTRANIESIMSRTSYEEILLADQDPQYNLEFHHGGAHVFVGGDMERLDTAANDVAFFLHHAFVDYIWELFRAKMRAGGLNPEQYPVSATTNDFHQSAAPMGFGNLTHAEGYLDALIDTYEYQPSPECSRMSPDCGSNYLWCDVAEARCVPINPLNPPEAPVTLADPETPMTPTQPIPNRNPRAAHSLHGSCPSPKPQAYQNSFCISGNCDINQWVWVPVKIMAQRPPEFANYHSYPVQNNTINKTGSDIYEPSAYSETSRYIKSDKPKPKSYDHCQVKDGVGKIFVSSYGLNYDGNYKESAIIDQRLATSIGVTYIAVKDPGTTGKSEVILRAHDQCGRICNTACIVPNSNPVKYQACSGVVEITSQLPKMYGQSYASATLMTYDYASDSSFPSFTGDNFFVTFYCDYTDQLPWVEKPMITFPGPAPVIPTNVVQQPNPRQCRINAECVINGPCFVDPLGQGRKCNKYMEKRECINTCGTYAVCNYATYWTRYCPTGKRFDDVFGQCVRATCLSFPIVGGVNVNISPHVIPNGLFGRLFGRFQLGK